MTIATAVDLFRDAFMATFWLSLPLLFIGFIVGVAVSLVQIVTSMQDASFGTIPRLGAFLFGTLLLMPWMLERLITYTTALFGNLGRYAR
jgi:flagellar biosynthesis protein FliQ